MGDLVEFKMTNKIIIKRMKAEAEGELKFLYQISAGFTDPLPPDEETRRAFEEYGLEI